MHSRHNLPYPRMIPQILLWAATAALLSGCTEQPPPGALDTVRMTIGNRTFTLEVADTDEARTYGLMRRDSMPRNHGMIFVFPDEQERGFWMKNVRFDLDITFLDADARVVSIHRMEAYDRRSTYSDGPAKYAIELNAGMAREAGVKVGDVLDIPPRAREPADES
jgi:uncharacterized protein